MSLGLAGAPASIVPPATSRTHAGRPPQRGADAVGVEPVVPEGEAEVPPEAPPVAPLAPEVPAPPGDVPAVDPDPVLPPAVSEGCELPEVPDVVGWVADCLLQAASERPAPKARASKKPRVRGPLVMEDSLR